MNCAEECNDALHAGNKRKTNTVCRLRPRADVFWLINGGRMTLSPITATNQLEGVEEWFPTFNFPPYRSAWSSNQRRALFRLFCHYFNFFFLVGPKRMCLLGFLRSRMCITPHYFLFIIRNCASDRRPRIPFVYRSKIRSFKVTSYIKFVLKRGV